MDLSPSDSELVAQVRDGEVRAFVTIMRRCNQRLYRSVRAILHDDAEAEDVVQETYLRALANLASFRGEAALSTWLTKIAVHEAFARLRRRRRTDRALRLERAEPARAAATPERRAYDDELRQQVELAIDALPLSLRSVFVLRVVEDLSVAETADILGVSTMTVKIRLFRARAALRRSISSGDPDPDGIFAFAGARCDRIVGAVLSKQIFRALMEAPQGLRGPVTAPAGADPPRRP